MNGKQIADLLRQARDLMNEKGAHWIKGASASYKDGDIDQPPEKFCSIGAIRYVLNGDPFADVAPLEYELCKPLVAQFNDKMDELTDLPDAIIHWNDASDREWDEIYAAFTNAALSAEASA